MTRHFSPAVPVLCALISWCLANSAAAAPPVLAWSRAIDGYGDDFEVAVAEVVDPEGNIYVTGGRNDSEIITMKLDLSGRVVWKNRAPFDRDGFGAGNAIARDHAGNIIVAGFSKLGNNDLDYTTIKYDSDGRFIWMNRYDGPGHGDDEPSAIAIDQDDNVFVTGFSMGAGTDKDFATVKYSADGVERWVARYDDIGSVDTANGIAIDALGRIVVVGQSLGNVGSEDIALLYYDQEGNQIMEIRYDGAAHGYDAGWAVAADSDGNVYVAGEASTDPSSSLVQGVLLKYVVDGTLVWTAFYDGPVHRYGSFSRVFIDEAGHVDTVGYSADWQNIRPTVVQYDSEGVEQWVARYSGTTYESTQLRGATIDASGNIYVIFKSPQLDNGNLVTIKYGSDGSQQWLASYDDPYHSDDGPRGIAVDSNGNVCVLGTCSRTPTTLDYQNYGMTVVKYDAGGAQLFASPLEFPGNQYDVASSIVAGPNNRTYVTGWSVAAGQAQVGDLMLLCFDGEGGLLWRTPIENPAHLEMYGGFLAVAPSGNAYVAGSIRSIGTGFDFFAAKFDPEGRMLWIHQYDGSGLDDYTTGIGIDADENVYIAGTIMYPAPPGFIYIDAATIKYSTDGSQQWVRHYSPQIGTYVYAASMKVDGDGNTWVAVYDCCTSIHHDIGLVKYDRDGVPQWRATYEGQNVSIDPFTMTLDSDGNAYVLGTTNPSIGMVTVKFTNDGNQEWATLLETGQPGAMRADSAGNAYVTGFASANSSHFLAKLGADGTEQWIAYRLSSSDAGTDQGLALDSAGNPYVTMIEGAPSAITTIRYDTAGHEVWAATLNGADGTGAIPTALTLDQQGNVLVCGSDYSWGGDALVAKYLNCVSPGDLNATGGVNGLAIQPFVNCLLGATVDCTCADMDGDGLVTPADVGPFVALLLSAASR